jgi:hypothetical protein
MLDVSRALNPECEHIEGDIRTVRLERSFDAVRVVHEEHLAGLFSRDRWLSLCRAAGFEPEIRAFRHSEVASELEVLLCRKPSPRPQ